MENIKILFIIRRNKINQQGLCPLQCRLTYNEDRKPFSTGLFVNPLYWDNKTQKAKPPNDENNFINAELSLIKNTINQAFLFLQVQGAEFDVEDIYKQYKGEPIQKQLGIVQFYSSYLERLKKMIILEVELDKFEEM